MSLKALQSSSIWAVFALLASLSSFAHAVEHVTLKNGFEVDCVRRETVGDKIRLYLVDNGVPSAGDSNYLEVAADSVVRVDIIADPPKPAVQVNSPSQLTSATVSLTKEEMHEMLAQAGAAHNIDADLLASIVRAESGGQVRAVSRVGAQGLMQLMPGTASAMGVDNAFKPDQNIAGGTAYLDTLLVRYHDNLVLAVAAYNAGPGAVDKYHGVPPYRETREYVARVIREFNRRKQQALVAQTK